METSFRKILNLSLRVAVFSAATASAVHGQGVNADQTKRIDELFAKWDRTDSPGCALSVMQGGHIVYKHA